MTTTWTTGYLATLASPADALPFLPRSRAFADQTVRQTVRLRRGGAAIRLVLSNEFGQTPLVFDQLQVSHAEFGQCQPALRDGAARWTIPAGQTATSDPIPLPIAADAELVISAYVAGSTEPAGYLHSAQRTGQFAPGNQTDRPELTDATEFTSLYWLTRVLVDDPTVRPVIVTIGDSITRGDGTSTNRDQRYPDHLLRRLRAAEPDAVVLNAGLGGNRLLRPTVGPALVDRFDTDVPAEATQVVIMAGLNDIVLARLLNEDRPTPTEITAGLLGLARRAHERGIRPILGTMTPVSAARPEFAADGHEQVRRAVNKALVAQADWSVIDFASALAAGEPELLAPAFDSGDGLHPNDAGARALADRVDLVLLRS